jgi:hypothetical protein
MRMLTLLALWALIGNAVGQTRPKFSISIPPANQTVLKDDDVVFNFTIGAPFTGIYQWRTFDDTNDPILTILNCQSAAEPCDTSDALPPPKYEQSGPFGLRINGADWTDGAFYSCAFIGEGVTTTASLVVIGKSDKDLD